MVKSIKLKRVGKNYGIGIENFGIGIDKFEVGLELELTKWN